MLPEWTITSSAHSAKNSSAKTVAAGAVTVGMCSARTVLGLSMRGGMNTLYASPAVLIISINDNEQNKPSVILFLKINIMDLFILKIHRKYN